MDPSTLPSDIYAILDERNDHEVSEANVLWAGEVFMDLLRSRFKKKEVKKGEEVLRFSSLGKQDRQLWYAANKPEAAEPLQPKQGFKFLFGDTIEVLLLFLAKEAGHEVTHEQYEVSADGVTGHTDCCVDGIPVDVKSASPFGYEKFKDGGFIWDDPFGYVKQLSAYAHALGKTDRAGFLVANKVHGDICFAEIDNYTIRGNPPEPRIAHLRSVIAGDRPGRCYPDKPDGKSGNRRLDTGCSYCAYREDCWSDSNDGKGLRKFYYANGPRFFTRIVKEPKVDEA